MTYSVNEAKVGSRLSTAKYVIDADAHAVENYDEFISLLPDTTRPLAPQFEPAHDGTARLRMLEGRPWQPRFEFMVTENMRLRQQRVSSGSCNARDRLRVLDSEGIDISVIFPSLGLYFGLYENPEIAAVMCRAENQWLAQWCAHARHRLAQMAVLPQQDPELAAVELVRAVEQEGAIGGVVRPNPCGGRRLDADDFDLLWRTAVDLDVPIVFHEGWLGGGYSTLGLDRARSYAAAHAMSHPFEAMSALLGIIQSGTLRRFRGLRLGFFEAGCGWAPWWTDRIAKHAALRPDDFLTDAAMLSGRAWLSFDPAEPAVEWVANNGWASSICFASDYPHVDAAYPDSVKQVRERRLSPEVERQVLCENALELFGFRLRSRLAVSGSVAQSCHIDPKHAFLQERANLIDHSQGTFLRHLEATSELLHTWSARPSLCDAGLFHAVYGTEAFDKPIATAHDRVKVQNLIGVEAEELAWLFGRCSQQSIVDCVAAGGPLVDRTNQRKVFLNKSQRRDLCELAVANWLEQRPRLSGEARQQLLDAVVRLEPWISPPARSAVQLASIVEADDQALRRWVSNSHSVITINLQGTKPALPSFEPEHVLARPMVRAALTSLANQLRDSGWDNVRNDHPLVRLALREPVSRTDLLGLLGTALMDILIVAGVLGRTDSSSDRFTLAVGLLVMGDEIIVVPADGRRRDAVYFGIEPLLLDQLGRALVPEATCVLECGAGAGLASVLAARRATTIASDLLYRASAFTMLTRDLNPHLQQRLFSVTGDGAKPFRASSFDLILANPPLVPGTNETSQPIYAYGGPTGSELPIRLLREALPLLQPGGYLVMITLDSHLHTGCRPLSEALNALESEYCWKKWKSPWRFLAPNSIPKLLMDHSAVLADTTHVGVAVTRLRDADSTESNQRLQMATAALSGSGWTPI